MSSFDPALMEEQIITEANETKSVPIPEDDYMALVDDYKLAVVGADKRPVLQITWLILNAEDKLAAVGLEEGRPRQTIWLDVTSTGTLAFGPNQNVGLGKLRDALDQNKPGQAWSFQKLKGAGPAKITVGHRPDSTDATIKYAEVKKVGKLAN